MEKLGIHLDLEPVVLSDDVEGKMKVKESKPSFGDSAT
jgi:hypothetical protein